MIFLPVLRGGRLLGGDQRRQPFFGVAFFPASSGPAGQPAWASNLARVAGNRSITTR